MNPKDTEIKKDLYLCIHGHFYQPPRENPWLEIIQFQGSASPYHDWNERITRECYGPNTRARVHGKGGRITRLINNYEYMSFDFGPTLLSWLEVKHPWIYSQILAADKASQKRHNGHGNALAHVYNHIIMPLANTRDKLTQIRWGIADFRCRFQREPEGMWLAETAVDTETLALMADEGIRFTILSPLQASAIRPIQSQQCDYGNIISTVQEKPSGWTDASGGKIDPSRPYRVFLNKGYSKFIDVFFYDGPLSRAIAYEKILSSGEALLGRINSILDGHKDGTRILSIATDGESYGHHFKFGEMALSWLFNHVEGQDRIRLINFGAFLEKFPPRHEVKIIEESSWSCAHGIERWRSDCGCSVNGDKECTQQWRTPLRDGLNWLSGELAILFERRAGRLLKDPWEARDNYINFILDKSQKDSFLKQYASGQLRDNEIVEILCLLESQRMALYMFTSCGWFFDDISGLESIQILMYAMRAIDLVRRSPRNDLEKGLMDFLQKAKSNNPSYKNGADIFETSVRPLKIDAALAVAHYAMMSLVEDVKYHENPFSDIVLPLRRNLLERDGIKAVLGEVSVHEIRTGRKTLKRYLSIHKKDQGFSCVIGNVSAPEYELIQEETAKAISESPESIITVFSMMAQDVQYFSQDDIIPDARNAIIDGLADSFYTGVKKSIVLNNTLFQDLVNVLRIMKTPYPPSLKNIFLILLADKFSFLLSVDDNKEAIDFEGFARKTDILQSGSKGTDMQDKKIPFLQNILSEPSVKKSAQDFLARSMNLFSKSGEIVIIENMIGFLKLTISQGIDLDLWEVQNMFYDTFRNSGFSEMNNPKISSYLAEFGYLLGFLFEEK